MSSQHTIRYPQTEAIDGSAELRHVPTRKAAFDHLRNLNVEGRDHDGDGSDSDVVVT